MLETRSDLISQLLSHTVAELDISPELRAAATAEYQRVGNWLAVVADGDAGWVVQPQGSFLLNTVVRPSGSDEYDLDAVCRREIEKHQTTQGKLKYEVGDVLLDYRDAHHDLPDAPTGLNERNRCWTLRYPASLRFHLDVLPAIPNPESPPSGILITDRELHAWQRSDPQAFAAWFKLQAAAEFITKRARLAEAAHTAPGAIPEWEVRTTLHRLVQVLKLHRNEFFRANLDARPASILLTTLAAHAYTGERNLYDAAMQAVELMPQYIERTREGYFVPNPVEPRENFADRWRHEPELARGFFCWLDRLGENLREVGSVQGGVDKVAARLQESLGEQPVAKGAGRLAGNYRRTRAVGALTFAPASGMLTTGHGTRVRNHDFYGDVGSA